MKFGDYGSQEEQQNEAMQFNEHEEQSSLEDKVGSEINEQASVMKRSTGDFDDDDHGRVSPAATSSTGNEYVAESSPKQSISMPTNETQPMSNDGSEEVNQSNSVNAPNSETFSTKVQVSRQSLPEANGIAESIKEDISSDKEEVDTMTKQQLGKSSPSQVQQQQENISQADQTLSPMESTSNSYESRLRRKQEHFNRRHNNRQATTDSTSAINHHQVTQTEHCSSDQPTTSTSAPTTRRRDRRLVRNEAFEGNNSLGLRLNKSTNGATMPIQQQSQSAYDETIGTKQHPKLSTDKSPTRYSNDSINRQATHETVDSNSHTTTSTTTTSNGLSSIPNNTQLQISGDDYDDMHTSGTTEGDILFAQQQGADGRRLQQVTVHAHIQQRPATLQGDMLQTGPTRRPNPPTIKEGIRQEEPPIQPRMYFSRNVDSNPPQSYSHLPMELRGSFIDGGFGPLQSSTTPGAFSAAGRAFGDLPSWFRGSRMEQYNHDRPRIPPCNGHDNDNSNSNERHDDQELPSHLYSTDFSCITEATLVDEREPRQSALVSNDTNLSLSSLPTLVKADKVGTNEDNSDRQSLLSWLRIIYVLAGILALIFVLLGALLFRIKRRGNAMENTFLDFPTPETLPSMEQICFQNTKITKRQQRRGHRPPPTHHHQPILQCYCDHEISFFPSETLETYERLEAVLMNEKVMGSDTSSTNCTEPQVLSLLWLTESDGNRYVAPTSLIQRYVLALLFHSWNGTDWNHKDNWLSTQNECQWYGITCNESNEIARIELTNNGLSGTSVPRQLNQFHSLLELDVSYNPELNGTLVGNEMVIVTIGTSLKPKG